MARLGPAPLLAALVPAPLVGLFLADSLVARARGFEPASRVDGVLLGMAAGIVGLAALGFVSSRVRSIYRTNAKRILLLNATLALALVAGDLVLAAQARHLGRERFHRRLPGTKLVFHPDPDLYRGASANARYTTSSLGIRGPELPATRAEATRILCLGASTTECVSLDDDRTWPALVGQALNAVRPTWVGNAGISGFSTYQHARFARESALMDEIDVLVVLCGINDLQGFLSGEHPPAEPLWRRTQLARSVTAIVTRVPAFQRWMYDISIFEPTLAMIAAFREPRRHARFTDDPGAIDGALESYALRIAEIARATREHGARPVFATQPMLLAKDLPPREQARCWFGWLDEGRTRFLTSDALRLALERHNEVLRRASAASNAGCIELGSMNGNPAYFEDDCHFTEAGAREVARLVVAWFQAHPEK